jgi:phage terminase small subunit
LSYRQRRFCEEYVLDYNATAAARRAGYKNGNGIERQAYQLLHHNGCEAYIAHLDKEKASQIQEQLLTPEYVVKKIIKAINTAEEKDQVMAVFRGAELLARHLGMLTDKQEIKSDETVHVKVQEDAQSFTDLLKTLAKKTDPNIKEVELIDG